MAYDYQKLEGRIIEYYGTQGAFARAMGLSERSVSLKMNSIRPWKQPEIMLACQLLDILTSEIGVYFFNRKVQCC